MYKWHLKSKEKKVKEDKKDDTDEGDNTDEKEEDKEEDEYEDWDTEYDPANIRGRKNGAKAQDKHLQRERKRYVTQTW